MAVHEPWPGGGVCFDSRQGFIPAGEEYEILGAFRTFAATQEDAKTCAQVAFRFILTLAGIDWQDGEDKSVS